MFHRLMISAVLAVSLAGATFACIAPALAASQAIPGTGDGSEILQALAEKFSKAGGKIQIEIPPSTGTGGGIAAVSDGRATIGRIARPLSAAEVAAGLVAIPVMKIPSAFFVHASTGVRGLTYEQLSGIYSGAVTSWNDVGGAQGKIRVVRRENEDSTLKTLRASMPGWRDLVLTPRSKTAVTTQDAVLSVKETEGAIGFGPRSSAIDKGLTILVLEGIESTSAAYPSAVTVSLVTKSGVDLGDAQDFVAFVKSAEAQDLILAMGGIPGSN